MTEVELKVGSKIFKLDLNLIPERCYLRSLIVTGMSKARDEEAIVLSEEEEDEEAFSSVFTYLKTGTFNSLDHIETFSYLGLDPCQDYDLSIRWEEEMRAKMYQPDFEKHSMNTDPHYGLVEITKEFWEQLKIVRPAHPDLLFSAKPIQKQSWEQIQGALQKHSHLLGPNVFAAGGWIFSALFGTKVNDIDLFFHGIDAQVANEQIDVLLRKVEPPPFERSISEIQEIQKLSTELKSHTLGIFENNLDRLCHCLYQNGATNGQIEKVVISAFEAIGCQHMDLPRFPCQRFYIPSEILYFTWGKNEETAKRLSVLRREQQNRVKASWMNITRTANSLTLEVFPNTYQVILRLYRTPSEILHGFDVDCCSLGYDGKRLWMTQRALYAICNGWNTVNFGRLSPSYEYRLAKYGTRGMAVKVPELQLKKINHQVLVVHKKKITFKYHMASSIYYRSMKRPPKEKQRATNNDLLTEDLRLNGLDVLLYLDFQIKYRGFHPKTIQAIEGLAEEANDYSACSFKQQRGSGIGNIIFYLIETQHQYPEYAKKYMPFLEGVADGYDAFNDDPEASACLDLTVNNIPIAPHIDFVRYWGFCGKHPKRMDWIKRICSIPQKIYDFLGTVRPWKIPRELQWKTINPGEQMTGTFHRLVLEDISVWYKGRFYSH